MNTPTVHNRLKVALIAIATALLLSLFAHKCISSEICFPLDNGTRLLHDVESIEKLSAEVNACREYEIASDNAIAVCREKTKMLNDRITELETARTTALNLLQSAREDCKKAIDVVKPKWYERVFAAGKWIVGGAVVGFVAALAVGK